MTFCASIHCMDGRLHEPVISYIKSNHDVKYIDFVVEPGIDGILAKFDDKGMVDSIIKRVQTCINVHNVTKIFVSGHYNCLANPGDKTQHVSQVYKAIEHLRPFFPQIEFIPLWIDENWQVNPC